jgi:hypothetical protein
VTKLILEVVDDSGGGLHLLMLEEFSFCPLRYPYFIRSSNCISCLSGKAHCVQNTFVTTVCNFVSTQFL